ncbi:MAG: hypothetical protein ACFFCS_10745 [Candidatus Hodarchaeota archaeon]
MPESRIKSCMYCFGEFLFVKNMQFCPLCGALILDEFKKQLDRIVPPNIPVTQFNEYPLIATQRYTDLPPVNQPQVTPSTSGDDAPEPVTDDARNAEPGSGGEVAENLSIDSQSIVQTLDEPPPPSSEVQQNRDQLHTEIVQDQPNKCKFCGAPLPITKNLNFCVRCGARIKPEGTQGSTTQEPVTSTSSSANNSPAPTLVRESLRIMASTESIVSSQQSRQQSLVQSVTDALLEEPVFDKQKEMEREKRVVDRMRGVMIFLVLFFLFVPLDVGYYRFNTSVSQVKELRVSFTFWTYHEMEFNVFSGLQESTHDSYYTFTLLNESFIFSIWAIFMMVLLITYLAKSLYVKKKPGKHILGKHVRFVFLFAFLGFLSSLICIFAFNTISSYTSEFGARLYVGILPLITFIFATSMLVMMQLHRRGPWITVPRSWGEFKELSPELAQVISILYQLKAIQENNGTKRLYITDLQRLVPAIPRQKLVQKLKDWRRNHLIIGKFRGYDEFVLETINFPLIYEKTNVPFDLEQLDLSPNLPISLVKGRPISAQVLSGISVIVFLLSLYASVNLSSFMVSFYYMIFTAPSFFTLLLGAIFMNIRGKERVGAIMILISSIWLLFMSNNYFASIMGLIAGGAGLRK